jgi:hypothetical protein
MQFLVVQIPSMLNLCHMTSNIFTITMLVFLMYTYISPEYEYVGMFLMPSSKDS